MDEFWKWLVGGGVGALLAVLIRDGAPALLALLKGRAESSRQDAKDLDSQRASFIDELQETIREMRSRLDQAEADIRECIRDRADLQARLKSLEGNP